MSESAPIPESLRSEIAELRTRLAETEEALRAIRDGEVDALVGLGDSGPQLFTLQGLDAEQSHMRGEMLAHVSDAVVTLDRDERVTFLNAAAEQCYSVRSENMVGRNVSDLFTSHWPTSEAEAAARAALEQDSHWCGENIHRTCDGRALPVEVNMAHVYEPSTGERVGLIIAVRDITARKEAHVALQRNAALFSKIIEQAPGGVYVVDAQFRMVQTNAETRLVFASVQPLIGRNFDEVMEIVWGPEIGAQCARIFRHTLATGERYVLPRFSGQRHDTGMVEAFEWETQRITLPDGQHGVVCYFQDVTARERAEAARRDSEERLHLAVKCSQIVLFQQDIELRYVWLHNPAPGFEGVEAIGKQDRDLMDCAEDAVRTEAMKREVIRTGAALRKEVEILVQGVGRYYDLLVEPMLNSAGVISGVTCAAIDITERKRVDENLEKSEKHLRYALESASAGAWDWDIRTGFIIWSPENYLLYDLDPTQGPSGYADWTSRIHPEDRARANEHVSAVLEGREAEFRMEFRVVSRQGAVRWLLGLGRVERGGDGRPLRLSGINVDISVRKHTEEALRASEARFRATFEQAAVGIAHVGLDGRWLRVNQKLCDIVGYSADELTRKTFQDITHRDDLDADLDLVRRLLADEIETYSMTKRYSRGNGSLVWVNLTVSLLRSHEGEPNYFISVVEDITARKLAEEQIRYSEELHRIAFDQSPIGKVYLDASGKFTKVNAAMCQIVGYTAEELGLMNIFDLLNTEDKLGGMDFLGPFLRGDQPSYVGDKKLVRKDGDHCWLAITARMVSDAEGRPLHVVGIFQDITARKLAESALLESNARYRAAVAIVTSLIWTNNAQGEMVGEQPGWGIFTGQSIVEYQGYGWASAVHPEDAQTTIEAWKEAVSEQRMFEFEHRLRRHDGEWRFCEVRAVPVFGEAREIREWIGVHTDITERKQAEELLRESEARLGSILRQSPAGIVLTDVDGRITLVNPRWCQMLGYPEEEVIGLSVIDITHSSSVDPTLAAVSRLAAGGPDFQIEKIYCRKDGSLLNAQSNVSALRSSTGEFVGLIAVVLDITERKRASEAAAQLAAIVDSSHDAIVSKDLQGSITSWNLGAQIMFGYSAEEIVGKSIVCLVPLDRRPEEHEILASILEGKGLNHFETVRLRKDGSLAEVSITMSPIRDAGGVITGASIVARDITEQKKAEATLRQNAGLFTTLIAQAPMGTYVVDSKLRIQQVNAVALPVFGNVQPLIGRRLDEVLEILWGAEVGGRCTDIFRHTLATGESYISPSFTEMRQDLSSTQSYEWQTKRVTLPGGAMGVVCYFHDITERTRASLALKTSQERMRLAAEATGVGIWEWDVVSDVVHWDAVMFGIYGITPTVDGIVQCCDWSGAVHPEDLAENEAILKDTVSRCGKSVRHFRIHRRHDGECRHIESVEIVRFDAEGDVAVVVGTNLDVTAQKDAERAVIEAAEKALAANAAKDRFLAALSHELRTPLTPVLLVSGLHAKSKQLPEDLREDFGMIHRNIVLEAQLIDDLLDVSRIQQGKMRFEFRQVDVHEAIARSLEMLLSEVAEKEISVRQQLCATPAIVDADPTRLRQVLCNLLRNAVKFTPNGGTITVKTTRDPSELHISVADSGAGIAAEDMERIFEAFEQVDQLQKSEYRSLGLGLAISAAIVTAHRGRIWAESPGRDKGATLHVTLPT